MTFDIPATEPGETHLELTPEDIEALRAGGEVEFSYKLSGLTLTVTAEETDDAE
jgi:hypothetical protein